MPAARDAFLYLGYALGAAFGPKVRRVRTKGVARENNLAMSAGHSHPPPIRRKP